MAALYTGRPGLPQQPSVDADTPGDPSKAGFVQVMQGRSSDPDRARELMANDPTDWAAYRPDILGTLLVGHDGDAWTMAIWFTSEAEAREGEQKEPPPEMSEDDGGDAGTDARRADEPRPEGSLAPRPGGDAAAWISVGVVQVGDGGGDAWADVGLSGQARARGRSPSRSSPRPP